MDFALDTVQKSNMLSMIDNLMIYKFLTQKGIQVPSNAPVTSAISYYTYETEVSLKKFQSFVSLAGIGVCKIKGTTNDRTAYLLSLRLYTLEKIRCTELSRQQQDELERILNDFKEICYEEDFIGEWNLFIAGGHLFYSIQGMYGLVFEYCKALYELHENLLKFMKGF